MRETFAKDEAAEPPISPPRRGTANWGADAAQRGAMVEEALRFLLQLVVHTPRPPGPQAALLELRSELLHLLLIKPRTHSHLTDAVCADDEPPTPEQLEAALAPIAALQPGSPALWTLRPGLDAEYMPAFPHVSRADHQTILQRQEEAARRVARDAVAAASQGAPPAAHPAFAPLRRLPLWPPFARLLRAVLVHAVGGGVPPRVVERSVQLVVLAFQILDADDAAPCAALAGASAPFLDALCWVPDPEAAAAAANAAAASPGGASPGGGGGAAVPPPESLSLLHAVVSLRRRSEEQRGGGAARGGGLSSVSVAQLRWVESRAAARPQCAEVLQALEAARAAAAGDGGEAAADEAARRARRRHAQQAARQQMARQRAAFASAIAAAAGEDGGGDEAAPSAAGAGACGGAAAAEGGQEELTCIMCHAGGGAGSGSGGGSMVALALLRPSRLRAAGLADVCPPVTEGDEEPLLAADTSEAPLLDPITGAPNSFQNGVEWQANHLAGDAEAHLQQCGHCMHLSCWRRYASSVAQRRAAQHTDQARVSEAAAGELLCPLCKGLSNAVLPLFPPPPEGGAAAAPPAAAAPVDEAVWYVDAALPARFAELEAALPDVLASGSDLPPPAAGGTADRDAAKSTLAALRSLDQRADDEPSPEAHAGDAGRRLPAELLGLFLRAWRGVGVALHSAVLDCRARGGAPPPPALEASVGRALHALRLRPAVLLEALRLEYAHTADAELPPQTPLLRFVADLTEHVGILLHCDAERYKSEAHRLLRGGGGGGAAPPSPADVGSHAVGYHRVGGSEAIEIVAPLLRGEMPSALCLLLLAAPPADRREARAAVALCALGALAQALLHAAARRRPPPPSPPRRRRRRRRRRRAAPAAPGRRRRPSPRCLRRSAPPRRKRRRRCARRSRRRRESRWTPTRRAARRCSPSRSPRSTATASPASARCGRSGPRRRRRRRRRRCGCRRRRRRCGARRRRH